MMKNQLMITLLLGLSLVLTNALLAQGGTAVGLRLGSPTSISLKHYFKENVAAEVYLGTRGASSYRWNNLSGAVQIHKPLDYFSELGQLSYYYGGGVSVYFWRYGNLLNGLELGRTSYGVQAYAGFDFVVADLPLNLSIDWIPTIFVGEGYLSGFRGGYGTVSVRYLLGR